MRTAVIKLFGETPSAIFQERKIKLISLEFRCLDILLDLCVGTVAYRYRDKEQKCHGRVGESKRKNVEIRWVSVMRKRNASEGARE